MKVESNSRGSATIPKDPEVLSTPDTPDSSALTVTPSIYSQHDGTCDSPVAPREKATDTCQLEMKHDSTVRAQEESGLACFHMRRGLTPLWNAKIQVTSGEQQ